MIGIIIIGSKKKWKWRISDGVTMTMFESGLIFIKSCSEVLCGLEAWHDNITMKMS